MLCDALALVVTLSFAALLKSLLLSHHRVAHAFPTPASSNCQMQTPPRTFLHPPVRKLDEIQRRIYRLEKEENFRWIARFLASPSPRVLTSEDILSGDLQREIADVGQFAEVAHGSFDPEFVWRNLSSLVQPTFPLEGYDALPGSNLVHVFHGKVANVQGYVAHRPSHHQVVVAFSGTSSPSQALHDVDAFLTAFPPHGSNTIKKAAPKVHRGFSRMYQGIRSSALESLFHSLKTPDVTELVLTGHSMGAAQATFLLMELLRNGSENSDNKDTSLPPHLTIKIVGFGCPRLGNDALVTYYRDLVFEYRRNRDANAFQEYFIKGYNDGVPCLPPKGLGFRHINVSSLYLFHGRLYRVPPSENEHSLFPMQLEDEDLRLEYPRGGHNYYNNRNMEKSKRRFRTLNVVALGEAGWEERYEQFLIKECRGSNSEGTST